MWVVKVEEAVLRMGGPLPVKVEHLEAATGHGGMEAWGMQAWHGRTRVGMQSSYGHWAMGAVAAAAAATTMVAGGRTALQGQRGRVRACVGGTSRTIAFSRAAQPSGREKKIDGVDRKAARPALTSREL